MEAVLKTEAYSTSEYEWIGLIYFNKEILYKTAYSYPSYGMAIDMAEKEFTRRFRSMF